MLNKNSNQTKRNAKRLLSVLNVPIKWARMQIAKSKFQKRIPQITQHDRQAENARFFGIYLSKNKKKSFTQFQIS